MSVVKITKYPNRKMYISKFKGKSGYCNNSDIKELLKRGYSVNVVDHRSGVDITHKVLVSIYNQATVDRFSETSTQEMESLVKQAIS